jgi:hypothetical protein
MNLLAEVYGLSCQMGCVDVAERALRNQKGTLMSIQEVTPEQLAELFHHYHQALAPDFGCATNSNPEGWERVPQQEKNRLVAAARLALLELTSTQSEHDSKRYFAKPGEAEWGC